MRFLCRDCTVTVGEKSLTVGGLLGLPPPRSGIVGREVCLAPVESAQQRWAPGLGCLGGTDELLPVCYCGGCPWRKWQGKRPGVRGAAVTTPEAGSSSGLVSLPDPCGYGSWGRVSVPRDVAASSSFSACSNCFQDSPHRSYG